MSYLLFYLITFVFSFLHELAHAGAARLCGCSFSIGTAGIFGNVVYVESEGRTVFVRTMIQIAGPAFNLAVVCICTGAARVCGGLRLTDPGLLEMVLYSNLMLAAFNLLPFFPLDGGRIFESLIAYLAGEKAARRAVTFFSRLFAVFIFLSGLYLVKYNAGNIILSFAAVYFWRMIERENENRLYARAENKWRERRSDESYPTRRGTADAGGKARGLHGR